MNRQVPIAIGATLVVVAGLLLLRAVLHDEPIDRLRDEGGGRRTGSIQLPRAGRYVFGLERGMRLEVDGRRPQPCHLEPDLQITICSIDLDAGVAAFAVEAPRGGRLLWHPAGRRGPLEYLPASSLSPDPPEQAGFGAGAGARWLDGLIALGVIAALAGCAIFLGRHRLRAALRADRRMTAAVLGVFALAAAVRLWDLGGAGQTFDEDTNWSAGRNYVANGVAVDLGQEAWVWNYEHPPVSKYLYGVGGQLADGFGPARATAALLVAAACALLVAIGARLWSWRAGLAAGVIAALTPHLIAHGKVVGHEAPTLFWWALGVWLALRAFDGDPAMRAVIRRLVGIGVVLGLAIASRFVNVLLGPLLGVILLIQAPPPWRLRTVGLGLAILPAVAIATLVALWPRMWSEPIAHLDEAWTKLSGTHAAEPYLGDWTKEPPPTYFVVYLAATAPLGVLLLCGAFVGRAVTRRRAEWRATAIAGALLLAPLIVTLSPVRQDGVRYVMPSLLALALMAGAGLDAVAVWLQRLRRDARLFAELTAAVGIYLAVTCARIHPYYLDYYGEQAGGPTGVAGQLELGWWGEGVDRAVAYVAAHAEPGDRVYRYCAEAYHLAWWHLDAWAHLAEKVEQADWIVVQPALKRCRVPDDFELVYTVDAMGAPLVRVYRR